MANKPQYDFDNEPPKPFWSTGKKIIIGLSTLVLVSLGFKACSILNEFDRAATAPAEEAMKGGVQIQVVPAPSPSDSTLPTEIDPSFVPDPRDDYLNQPVAPPPSQPILSPPSARNNETIRPEYSPSPSPPASLPSYSPPYEAVPRPLPQFNPPPLAPPAPPPPPVAPPPPPPPPPLPKQEGLGFESGAPSASDVQIAPRP
jgi:hypothetical protein